MGGLLGGGGNNTTISTVDPVAAGLRIQTSAYGLCLPIVIGRTRVPGNLLWYGDFTAVPHVTTTSSGGGGGGKGGGGGSTTSTNTSYTYTAAFALGLGEGPLTRIDKCWRDKDAIGATSDLFTIFTGTYPQSPWSFLTSSHPGEAVPYQGVGYVAASAYDLGANDYLQNHTFEVTGLVPFNPGVIDDANPSDALTVLLSNAHCGAGFPSSKIGDLTAFRNYCTASNLFLSPYYGDQTQAADLVTQLMLLSNGAIFFSEGLLKVVPLGDTAATANGVTYTPTTTPLYDLTDDDYLDLEEPVRVVRNSSADAFNDVQVEYVNRDNDYNVEVMEAKDLTAIDVFGLRVATPTQAHEITTSATAQVVAQLLLQRSLFIRNTFEFRVGWKYCLLEPADIVTLTDASIGLNKYPVRILSIEEDGEDGFTMIAEDYPAGVSSAATYQSQAGVGYSSNYNASPGDCNPPVIFEAPAYLTNGQLEVWLAASGGPEWGGAQVWVSLDGDSYLKVGVVSNPSRQGVLSAALPSSAVDPDLTNTLHADLSMSRSTLGSATKAEADAYATLCYVGGELISYRDATLISANHYDLGYLRRGVYGTTISSHASSSQFCRIDAAAFRYPFTPDQIGTRIYVKLLSFNIWGGGQQALADLTPTIYTITGSALQSPLPDLTGVGTNYLADVQQIYWNALDDFRQPNIDYEIRFGASWDSSVVVGRTPLTSFTPPSNGTYWISGHYMTSSGINAYSQDPSQVIITGAALQRNVIAVKDEHATGWIGTLTNTVNISGAIYLDGGGDLLSAPDFLGIADVLWYGGVAASGSYDLPASHAVDIGRVAPCLVGMSYTSHAESINNNFLTLTDVLSASDLFDSYLGPLIGCQPQIAIAGNDGIYSSWQNFQPGIYNARYFKARILLASSDPSVNAVLTEFVFTVDVPDRLDPYQVTSSSSASVAITYSAPFNGGVGASSLPLVQGTILNAQAGDDLKITGESLAGCSVDVYNSGVRVVRTLNLQVQGY